MMIHRKCGGKLVEREDLPAYRDENGNFCAYPIYCKKCNHEILGDTEVYLPGLEDERNT